MVSQVSWHQKESITLFRTNMNECSNNSLQNNKKIPNYGCKFKLSVSLTASKPKL